MAYDKFPAEKKDYAISWSKHLNVGETISSSTWAVLPNGLVRSDAAFTDTLATVWLSGGTGGVEYIVTNHVVTNEGREFDRSFVVNVVSAPGFAGSGGQPDPTIGSDALTIVNGGTVTLDDTKAEGSLVGYRVKATTTFEGEGGTADLGPGAYTFERTADGWTYYVATGTALTTIPVSAWTTLASEDFPQANGTALTAITTDGFSWESGDAIAATVQANKATFVGHAAQNRSLLAVNQSGATSGFRIRAAYDVSANSELIAGLIMTSEVNGNPYYDALEASMNGSGTLSLTTYQGTVASVGGQPTTGTMEFEMTDTAAVVRINGTQVLAGTMPRTVNGRAAGFRFAGASSAAVTFDDVFIERLA